jgi:serine/threonine protein kinase
MAFPSPCPEVQPLQRLLLGQVTDDEAEGLECHLATCDACLRTIRAIPTQETLADAMRSRSTLAETPLPETVQRLIQHLKSLQPPGLDETSGDTSPTSDHSPSETPAPPVSQPAEEKEEGHAFLAPPQGPGELGRLGTYRVLRVLGVGGMGVVFQAEDPGLKRTVALKAMKPALAASDTARKRFLREAQATAALDHDHIVHIYQVGEDRGVPFLAMQLLKGQTLEDRLRRENKMPLAEVLRIGREVADGLAEAHQSGLIHRDIKPSNIWLAGDRQRVKILDFGLARAVADDAHLTQSGTVTGTPAYMAPEQAQGQQVDARSDLFSLGCVLYRLCTGEVPFRGANTMATLLAVVQTQPKPPRELDPDTPPALSELVMRLLAKDPAKRPSSADAVIEAIESIGRERTDVLSPTGISGERRGVNPPVRLAPSRRWLMVVAVVALLVGSAILIPQIIVRIHDKEGKEVAKVEIPKGGGATLEQPGKPPIKIPGEAAKPKPETKKDGPTKDLVPLPVASVLDKLERVRIPAYELALAGDGDPNKAPPNLVAIFGESRLKHFGGILSVAYSPDSKKIASCGYDGTVRVWDAATGEQLFVFRGHTIGMSTA